MSKLRKEIEAIEKEIDKLTGIVGEKDVKRLHELRIMVEIKKLKIPYIGDE